MKAFLFVLLALSCLLVIYALWIRPWLRKQPWSAGFFAAIDGIELKLWKKSETILFARLKMAIGIILTLLTQAGEIDVTPIMPLVPERWQGIVQFTIASLPLIITVVGWIDQQLRYDTTKPIEVVAVSVDAPVEVKQMVQAVETTNAVAVATVEVAKAEAADAARAA